jgi:hypothetical protein
MGYKELLSFTFQQSSGDVLHYINDAGFLEKCFFVQRLKRVKIAA